MALNWDDFNTATPEIAAAGRALLYQYGIGLGFLATVRKDGGPRVHPCCPIIAEGRLCVFILEVSPKLHDLNRDGRYALHSNPCATNDDEFYIAGLTKRIEDAAIRSRFSSLAKHNVKDTEVLFEMFAERALHTTWKNPRQPNTEPVYSRWTLST